MSTADIRADEELVGLLHDFFAHEVTPDVVEAAERAGVLPTALWDRASTVQIPWIGVSEEHGGVGGTFADVVALVHQAAYRATPLPLLEHHLAATLIARAGLASVGGPLSVAGLSSHGTPLQVEAGRVSGRVAGVPWAADVTAVVVLATDESHRDVAAVVRRQDYEFEPATAIDGTPSPTLVLDHVPVESGRIDDVASFMRYADVLRCSALSGMMSRLYDMTSVYVSERHQFGKPISSFQSVQAHVVAIAQAVSISGLSVDRAAAALLTGTGEFEVAATSVVVGEQALKASASAHQAHGAIGMTREYPLQHVTRRIHTLVQAWEPAVVSQERVGRVVLGSPGLSTLVAQHPAEGVRRP